MNKLFITGRVGRTPETRTISTGDTVCSFSLAVNNKRKGEQDQPPTWFKVSAWGKLGEACQRYLDKGKMATVVGPVSGSTYDGSDGKTRFYLDVRAEDVEFLSPKEQSDAEEPTKKPVPDGFTEVDDESLPF